MEAARSHLTLRRIFVSLFWFGVLFAAWAANPNPLKHQKTESLLLGLYAIRVIAIFPAVGALFGRTVIGISIGCALFILIILGILITLRFSGGGWAI